MQARKKIDYSKYYGSYNPVFVPNWKRNGFKTKEEGVFHAIKTLMSQSKMLMKKGLGEALSIQYGGQTFFIQNKGKKEG